MRHLFLPFAAAVLLSGSWACFPVPPSSGAVGGGGGGGGGGGVASGTVGGGGGGFTENWGDGGGGGPGGGSVGGGSGCFQNTDDLPVVAAWRPPPPISGGTMAVMSDGTVVIGDTDRDEVHLIGTDFAVRHAPLQPGDEPGRVIEGPAGTAFVALRRAGSVAQIDVSTLTVQRFTTCPATRGLAWRDDLKQLLVACSDGELATIDFSGAAPMITTRHLIDDLRDVVVLNGQVLVTTFRSAQVYALDAQGNPSSWSAPNAIGDPNHDLRPEVAWRALPSPQGLLMVHQLADSAAVPASMPCFSPWGSPAAGTSSSTLSPEVSLLTQGHSANFSALPTFALPVDVAATPDASRIAVAFAGSGDVVFWNSSTPEQPIGGAVMGQPVSVAFRGDQLLVFTREPARLVALDTAGVITTQLPLSALSMADTGHDLFHFQTSNGIACASCHPEATDDGHVWNLPNGLRRTPSLRGGIKGTEPFHWDGEETSMSALVSDVFVDRMGGKLEDDAHVGALLDWIDAQPKRAAPGDLDPSAVARGASAFVSLGCVNCHAGDKGTNNLASDVGTGGAFQVPRLVELAYRAPFFHDGHIATLADRFSAAGGLGHTATQGLSADQISDLVAYLKSR